MKRLLLSAMFGAIAVGAIAQAPPPSLSGRSIFGYDPSVATNGWGVLEITDNSLVPTTVGGVGDSSAYHVGPNSFRFGATTRMRVRTYVYAAGTLSGVYDVRGYGELNNPSGAYGNTQHLTVHTNRNLRAVPYGFTNLLHPTTSAVGGDMEYSLQWATSAGVPLFFAAQGAPGLFNGNNVDLYLAFAPAGHNGSFRLTLSRNLKKVYENALGGTEYFADGSIYLTVLN